MGALAWLNDLIQWLGRWIPRLELIHPTHRGVRFGPSGRAVEVGPGLVFYWPMTHDLVQVAVTAQSIQLCGQILPLPDDTGLLPRVALCTLNLQFQVTDVVKAATSILNFHALVGNRAQALATQYWCKAPNMTQPTWLTGVEQQLRSEMVPFGIDVKFIDAAGLGIGVALKNVADWSYADNVEERRKPVS